MSPVRRTLQQCLALLLAAVFLITSTGCESMFTARVWNAPKTFNEPATQPDLQIYQKSSRTFFVRYRSVVEGSENATPSIFVLDADHPFDNPYHPRFLPASSLQGLEKIPVLVAGASSQARVFAVSGPDFRSFVIHSGSETLGPFVLPTFESEGSRQRRLFLTPAAVLGDVVIVGSLIGLVVITVCWPVGHSIGT